ncbi:N-acyl-aromatic-L-amino acid amidohydrolase (carboxylate-forming)-like [Ambystoma mexicanum]|uniref:N-acyl-aromatic-L-amino acid amidohydrolase (carboxylate-forming)-like n=1 Tax=Ambystoma mexicanum TaxID=8296 RepID=UPI0037E75635
MSSTVVNSPLRRVAVAGGTHGNEMSGIYLVRHWMQDPTELHRGTVTASPFLANPRAVEKCVRYIDQDLNRSFTEEILASTDSDHDAHEVRHARQINQQYGPRGSVNAWDFVIDLHNTTANMGSTIIIMTPEDHLSMHLSHYLQSRCEDSSSPCRVIMVKEMIRDPISLITVGKHGIGLEVGPQPQGVVKADILTRMRTLVNCSLDFMDLFNQGAEFPAFEMEAFGVLERVDYPRNAAGEPQAVIHSKLQDKDFLPVNPGDPLFLMLNGEEILYDGESTIYPSFINEAAYYEKNVAFIKLQRLVFSVPAIRVKN